MPSVMMWVSASAPLAGTAKVSVIRIAMTPNANKITQITLTVTWTVDVYVMILFFSLIVLYTVCTEPLICPRKSTIRAGGFVIATKTGTELSVIRNVIAMGTGNATQTVLAHAKTPISGTPIDTRSLIANITGHL
jgi:hypothetical protein